jgi:hypothetical protein
MAAQRSGAGRKRLIHRRGRDNQIVDPIRNSGKTAMSSFDDREKAYENKFAHDQELEFKANARRNRMLGQWAAGLMDLGDAEAEAYAAAVVKSDLEEAGDQDVFRKLRADFDAKGVTISDAELRHKMDMLLAEARQQVQTR